MKRSTLRVLLSQVDRPAPNGYFKYRNGGDVRVAIRPAITPTDKDAAALRARMVRS